MTMTAEQSSSEMHRASQALAACSVTEIRNLRVDETEDRLELSGIVRSFYHKQLAQEIVRPIADGRRLVNQVSVAAAE